MKAILHTRCGATQEIELPDPVHIYSIPMKSHSNRFVPDYSDPRATVTTTMRRFELVEIYPDGRYPVAHFEEIE